MQRTIIGVLFFLAFASAGASAQSSFRGLTPGVSTREETSRVFGNPVRDVSETLSEYRITGSTDKIYVQFRKGANVIERIEVLLAAPSARSALISSLNLNDSEITSKINSRGKREEYFGSGKFIVLSHVSSDDSSLVDRIGYYSPELFAPVAGSIDAGQAAHGAQQATPPERSGTTSATTNSGDIGVTLDGESVGTSGDNAGKSKKSGRFSISNLKLNEHDGSLELVFSFSGPSKEIDPKKSRLIV